MPYKIAKLSKNKSRFFNTFYFKIYIYGNHINLLNEFVQSSKTLLLSSYFLKILTSERIFNIVYKIIYFLK